MKIDRPKWTELGLWDLQHGELKLDYSLLDDWFDHNVEPINKIISEGQKVKGNFRHSFGGKPEILWGTSPFTHEALIINAQPIKKETAEDVLKEMIKLFESREAFSTQDLVDKAKNVLNEK